MRSKAEKGLVPKYPPIGYLNSKLHEKGNETIVTMPGDEFPIIRKMWDLMLKGTYTPPKILEVATKEWGLTLQAEKTWW